VFQYWEIKHAGYEPVCKMTFSFISSLLTDQDNGWKYGHFSNTEYSARLRNNWYGTHVTLWVFNITALTVTPLRNSTLKMEAMFLQNVGNHLPVSHPTRPQWQSQISYPPPPPQKKLAVLHHIWNSHSTSKIHQAAGYINQFSFKNRTTNRKFSNSNTNILKAY
jgi:hypothetical protein